MYDEAVEAFRTHWDSAHFGWQGEYWGKTMLSFGAAAAYAHDAKLRAFALDRASAFVREFQSADGYVSTVTNRDDVGEGFSVWGRKYTLWALTELAASTGDSACRDAAVRLLDNLIAQLRRLNRPVWQTGIWHGVSSMSVLKPVLRLYVVTGKAEYRAFADEIIAALRNPELKEGALLANARRKDWIFEWFPKPGYWAKAYEIMSCLEGAVYYSRVTGDKAVLDDVKAFYAHLEDEELNCLRSVGLFDHFWGARVRFNGMTELCDVIHWIRLNRELLMATGDAKYADRIEEAFYNAFLAGVAADGRWGAHIVRSHGTRHLSAPPQTGMFHHQCCPDNMLRVFVDLAGSVADEARDGALAVMLYGAAEARLPSSEVHVTGDYPHGDGTTTVRIRRKTAGRVRFRIPAWSARFTVNGVAGTAVNGWYEAEAPAGESIWALAFDFSPRVLPHRLASERILPPSPQPNDVTDVWKYTVHFMELHTPDMTGLGRSEPAIQVMRGPVVLAKGRRAGTPRGQTFATGSYDNGTQGWQASLVPAPANADVRQAWRLTLTRGVESVTVPVADFASVSSGDDPDNWFSLWF